MNTVYGVYGVLWEILNTIMQCAQTDHLFLHWHGSNVNNYYDGSIKLNDDSCKWFTKNELLYLHELSEKNDSLKWPDYYDIMNQFVQPFHPMAHKSELLTKTVRTKCFTKMNHKRQNGLVHDYSDRSAVCKINDIKTAVQHFVLLIMRKISLIQEKFTTELLSHYT